MTVTRFPSRENTVVEVGVTYLWLVLSISIEGVRAEAYLTRDKAGKITRDMLSALQKLDAAGGEEHRDDTQ